jgi:hypothetical protein
MPNSTFFKTAKSLGFGKNGLIFKNRGILSGMFGPRTTQKNTPQNSNLNLNQIEIPQSGTPPVNGLANSSIPPPPPDELTQDELNIIAQRRQKEINNRNRMRGNNVPLSPNEQKAEKNRIQKELVENKKKFDIHYFEIKIEEIFNMAGISYQLYNIDEIAELINRYQKKSLPENLNSDKKESIKIIYNAIENGYSSLSNIRRNPENNTETFGKKLEQGEQNIKLKLLNVFKPFLTNKAKTANKLSKILEILQTNNILTLNAINRVVKKLYKENPTNNNTANKNFIESLEISNLNEENQKKILHIISKSKISNKLQKIIGSNLNLNTKNKNKNEEINRISRTIKLIDIQKIINKIYKENPNNPNLENKEFIESLNQYSLNNTTRLKILNIVKKYHVNNPAPKNNKKNNNNE